MMKKTLFVFVALLASSCWALNFEINVTQPQKTYDNESMLLNVIITNNEIGFSAEQAQFHYVMKEQETVIDLGDLEPSAQIEKQIDFGEQSAGSYSIDYFVTYNFVGQETSTQIHRLNAVVLLSHEIVMKTYPVIISNIRVPNKIEVSKPFIVSFNLNTTVNDVEINISTEDKSEEVAISTPTSMQVEREMIVKKSGGQFLTISSYVNEDGQKILKDTKKIQLYVVNLDETKPVEVNIVRPEEKPITISNGTNLFDQFVSDVSCFATGCKTDLQGPELSDFRVSENENEVTVTFIADDTNTGNSTIVSCEALTPSGAMSIDVDGNYGKVRIAGSFKTKNMDQITSIEIRCLDDTGNSASSQVSFKKKESGTLAVHLTDKNTKQPVSNAVLYVNGIAKVTTKDDGTAAISLYPSDYDVKIKKKGYELIEFTQFIEEKKTSSRDFELEPALEAVFNIPLGYEEYVTAQKASGTNIHPQEKQLMQYSFPLLSKNKVDVAKDLISVVDKYLDYDMSCYNAVIEKKPIPSICKAWHTSDYDIIQTHSGVCYDWATLGTSFSNSYGIPSRFVHGCWTSVSLTGKKESLCHAWEEVYLPELGGWKHLDTLWNEFDNPCVYAKQLSVSCVSSFAYYDPSSSSFVSLDSTYGCRKICGESSGVTSSASLKPENIFSNGAGFEYQYKISINKNSVNYRFGRNLTENEIDDINKRIQANQLNNTQIKEYLFRNLYILASNPSAIISEPQFIDNNSFVLINITYNLSDNQFIDNVILSQYDSATYEISSDIPLMSISPVSEAQISQDTIHWNFDKPGEKNIRVSFAQPKTTIYVLDSDISSKPIITYDAGLLGYDVVEFSGNETPASSLPQGSKVIIAGFYTDISSNLDDMLIKRNNSVLRFNSEEQIRIADIIRSFNNVSSTVYLVDVNDFEAIDKGILEAKKENAIVLGSKMAGLDPDVKSAIQQLQPNNIVVIYSQNNPSAELVAALSSISNISMKKITPQNAYDVHVSAISEQKIEKEDNLLPLMILATVIVIVIVVWKVSKKSNR